jgi:hypothetical protein
VVKVNLATFEVVETLTLDSGENKLSSAVIDMGNSRAYFGTDTSPGRVIRVNINPGEAFAAAGSHTVSRNRLSSAVIDSSVGRAYFARKMATRWPTARSTMASPPSPSVC